MPLRAGHFRRRKAVPVAFSCAGGSTSAVSLLLGTAHAKVSLDIGSFMQNATTAQGAMNDLAKAGSSGSGGGFFDGLSKGALGLGTALIAPMSLGLKAAADLEQSVANLNASFGGLDTGTLDNLSAKLQDIAVNSQYSATEVAAIGDGLAKAGFTVDEVMNGATQAVVDLSQATGDGLQPAMDAVITSMSIWSEEIVGVENAMTDSTRIADIFTIAANNSSAGVSDINAGMRSLGPVAAGLGIPLEDSAAAIALFTNYGLKGADAGVSLARGLSNLADPASNLDSELGTLGLSMEGLGIQAFDLEGNFVGFPTLFEQLNTGMSGLDDQTKQAALGMIFGAEAADVMALAIATGADPLQALIDLMGESGAAAEQSALRMDTLGAQFDTLKEGALTFLGSLVSGLIPGLRFVVDGANDVLDVLMKIPAPIKAIVGGIAGGLAAFAAITQAFRAFSLISGPLGGTGFLGLGVSLGALIPVALGVAAVAGLIYAAWKTNFLGLRTVVQNALKPITKFIDRFRDAWAGLEGTSDVMEKILGWGGQADKIIQPVSTLSRILVSLGAAIRGIGDGDIPFFNTIADGLDRAAGFVDRFKSAWDSLGVSDITSQINEWGGVTSDQMGLVERAMAAFDIASGGMLTRLREMTALDIVISIGSFIFDGLAGVWDQLARQITGIPQGTPVTLGDVAASIGGWVISSIADLWGAVKAWAGGEGYVPGDSITVGDIAVAIGGWIVTSLTSIGQAITDFVLGNRSGDSGMSGDGTGGATPGRAYTVGDVAIAIGGWVVSSLQSIGDAISNFVMGGPSRGMEAGPGGMRATESGYPIGVVALTIGSWLVSATQSIGTAISNFVMGGPALGMESAPGGMRATGDGYPISAVALKIADWIISAAKPLGESLRNWITGTAMPAISQVAMDLAPIAIKISGWTISAAVDLWGDISTWITGQPQGTDVPISEVRASIHAWKINALQSIGDAISAFVSGNSGGNVGNRPDSSMSGSIPGAGYEITEAIKLTITNWSLDLLDRDASGDITASDVIGFIDDALEGMVGVDIEIQDWKLALANPDNDLTVMDIVGWVDDALEGMLGIDVELQDWKLDLGTPDMGDVTASDVIGWIDDKLEGFLGIDVELQDWKLNLGGAPDVEADQSGIEAAVAAQLNWTKMFNRMVQIQADGGNTVDQQINNNLPGSSRGGRLDDPMKNLDPTDNFGAWRELNQLIANTTASVGVLNATPVSVDASGGVSGIQAVKDAAAGLRGDMSSLKSLAITVDTSSAVANLGALKATVDTTGSALSTLKTSRPTITVETASAVSALKTLDSAVATTKLNLDGLSALKSVGAGADRAAGMDAAKGVAQSSTSIKITADNTDALAKIAAVKDAVSGLGGGGGGIGRAAAGAGAGSGIAAATISVDTTAAMTAISTLQAALDMVPIKMAVVGLAIGTALTTGIATGVSSGGATVSAAVGVIVGGTAIHAIKAIGTGLGIGTALGNGITTGVQSKAGAVSGAVGTVVGGASSQSVRAVGVGLGVGGALGNGIASGITGKSGAVSAAAGSAVAAAGGASARAVGVGISIGRALGQGIVSGLNSQQGAVSAAASKLIGIANSAAKIAGGIRSPSSIWDYFARMMGAGLVRGFDGSQMVVSRASASLIGSANAALGMLTAPSLASIPVSAPVSAAHRGGNGGTVIHLHNETRVNVEGNVTAEDDLTLKIVRTVNQGMGDAAIQLKRSLGAT